MANQEVLIKNLAQSISEHVDVRKAGRAADKNQIIENKARALELDRKRFVKEQLKLKLKQLDLLCQIKGPDHDLSREDIEGINGFTDYSRLPTEKSGDPSLIEQGSKILALRKKEDDYYKKIQACVQELEKIKTISEEEEDDQAEAEDNLGRQVWLYGVNGQPSEKEQMEKELVML